MRRTLSSLAAAAIVLAAGSAFAMHCPQDMGEIDAALPQAGGLTAEQRTQVMDYRSRGEAYHRAGDHQASMEILAKAKAILGLQH